MIRRYITNTNGRIGWAVVLAGLIAGAPATEVRADGHAVYTPPSKGLELTWSRIPVAGGKTAAETFLHRVVRADKDEVLYQVISKDDGNGDRVHLFGGLFSYAYWRPGVAWVEYKFDRAMLRKLWPLAPGKETRVKMRFGYGEGKTIAQAKANWKETEVGEIHYRVLRREKVTVPAGTFDAFVIERNRRFTKHDKGKVIIQRRVGWLVPKLGYVVKQTVRKGPAEPKAKISVLQVISVKRPSSAK